MLHNPFYTRNPAFLVTDYDDQPELLWNRPEANGERPYFRTTNRNQPECVFFRAHSSDSFDTMVLYNMITGVTTNAYSSARFHVYTIPDWRSISGAYVDVVMIYATSGSVMDTGYYQYRITDTGGRKYASEVFLMQSTSDCDTEQLCQFKFNNSCNFQGLQYAEHPNFRHDPLIGCTPVRPQAITEIEIETNNLNEREIISSSTVTEWTFHARLTIHEYECLARMDRHDTKTLDLLRFTNNFTHIVKEIVVEEPDYSVSEVWPTVRLKVRTVSKFDACCDDVPDCPVEKPDAPVVVFQGTPPSWNVEITGAAIQTVANWIVLQLSTVGSSGPWADIDNYTPAELVAGITYTIPISGNVWFRYLDKSWACELASNATGVTAPSS